jgi:hypothetical protein
MTRTYYVDYADRAYERYRTKLYREIQWNAGGRANGHPRQSKLRQNKDTDPDSVSQQPLLRLFRKYGNLIALRRDGKTLQEIADEVGESRLNVHRMFQRLLDQDQKLELGLPT